MCLLNLGFTTQHDFAYHHPPTPSSIWQYLETALFVTLGEGFSWHWVGRGWEHCSFPTIYTGQPHNKELSWNNPLQRSGNYQISFFKVSWKKLNFWVKLGCNYKNTLPWSGASLAGSGLLGGWFGIAGGTSDEWSSVHSTMKTRNSLLFSFQSLVTLLRIHHLLHYKTTQTNKTRSRELHLKRNWYLMLFYVGLPRWR